MVYSSDQTQFLLQLRNSLSNLNQIYPKFTLSEVDTLLFNDLSYRESNFHIILEMPLLP